MDDYQMESLVDQLGKMDFISNDQMRELEKDLKTPEYGLLILRQLLADPNFKESIQKVQSADSDCFTPKIPLENPSIANPEFKEPELVAKSCNPGNTEFCTKYGLDPCCLSKDLLEGMKQYYPRCERIKICDVENFGISYWDRYLYFNLPYEFNAT
jgi:hypothetical protein